MKIYILVPLALLVFNCDADDDVRIKHLPDRLKDLVCYKSDENYDECFMQTFQKWIVNALEGIPEFGIPPIDPLQLESFHFERIINEELKISGVLANVLAFGAGKTVLEGFKSDTTRLKTEHKIRVPYLNASVDYNVNGMIFGVPFKSEGHFEGSFVNIRLYVKVAAIEVERGGVKVLQVDKIRPKMKLADGHIRLVAADPALQSTADAVAVYFNNNPSRAVEAMQRFFEAYPDDTVLRDLINQELTQIPAAEILPD